MPGWAPRRRWTPAAYSPGVVTDPKITIPWPLQLGELIGVLNPRSPCRSAPLPTVRGGVLDTGGGAGSVTVTAGGTGAVTVTRVRGRSCFATDSVTAALSAVTSNTAEPVVRR